MLAVKIIIIKDKKLPQCKFKLITSEPHLPHKETPLPKSLQQYSKQRAKLPVNFPSRNLTPVLGMCGATGRCPKDRAEWNQAQMSA